MKDSLHSIGSAVTSVLFAAVSFANAEEEIRLIAGVGSIVAIIYSILYTREKFRWLHDQRLRDQQRKVPHAPEPGPPDPDGDEY